MKTHALFVSTVLLLIGAAAAPAEEKVNFDTQILPIFVKHCAKCHGAEKAQGKMRLNTVAAIREKIAADPKLITPGEPDQSELYQRIVLPEDSPKRMPKGAAPLPESAVALIGRWIREGAELPTAAPAEPGAAPAPSGKEEAAAEAPSTEAGEQSTLPEVPPAPQEALDRLTQAGAQTMPLFAGSSLLQVSFAHRDQPVGDADVALLADVAEQVYTLNLAGAKVSDDGLEPLARLKNLDSLHLELSSVTDRGLAHLAGLGRLQYLNLYGTGITDAGLKHLAGLKRLSRLYLWQTNVSYDAAMALEKDIPGLLVNLGYNHPVVAKKRLAKEMELAKKQADDAKAEVSKAEQQLEAAKKNAEATAARVTEIEKELKALEPPADKPEEKKAEEPAGEQSAEKPQEEKAEN